MVSQRRVKRLIWLCLIGSVALIYIKYNGKLTEIENREVNALKDTKGEVDDRRNPVILIWSKQKTTFRADPEVCGINVECDITYDKDLVGEAAAVIFHMYYTNIRFFPKHRSSHQLYVWWTLEARHFLPLREYDNVFNLTFTYRTDSDIYAPYGSIHLVLDEISKDGEPDIDELMDRKRKSGRMAIWAVSNCKSTYRLELTKNLETFGVDVDKYGSCFKRNIERGDSFHQQISQYKFYFAFENNHHCKDYITEKFWFNGLKAGAVPVVWGPRKEDIMKVAPTHSFIHVEDFESTEELAKYLIYLSEHEEEYVKYLEWRKWVKHPELIEERLRKENMNGDVRSFCSLCQMITDHKQMRERGIEPEHKVISSITKFWWRDENRECLKHARFRAGFVDELYKIWP